MIYGTHLSSIYQEHAKELQKQYYRVVSRRAVVSANEQAHKAVFPVLSSSHKTAATVRLAAYTSLDIVV